jgi:mRNA interferase RelE/StbE
MITPAAGLVYEERVPLPLPILRAMLALAEAVGISGGIARVKNLDTPRPVADTDSMATVTITAEAHQEAERLPVVIRTRIYRLLQRLTKWPEVSGAKALSGNLAGWYRLRTGDYRLRFRVEGETVIVDKIGHRREFYED